MAARQYRALKATLAADRAACSDDSGFALTARLLQIQHRHLEGASKPTRRAKGVTGKLATKAEDGMGFDVTDGGMGIVFQFELVRSLLADVLSVLHCTRGRVFFIAHVLLDALVVLSVRASVCLR